MKNIFPFLLMLSVLSVSAQEASKTYDKIGGFHQGVAIVWSGGHCGLISQATKKEIIKPIYDRITDFGNDGLAFTTKDGMIGVVNIQGQVIVQNIYTYISAFHGYYAITRKNGLAGMINKQGKVLVDNKYESIKVERNGVIRAVKEGKEVLLDVKE